MAEFRDRHAELAAAGFSVAALSADEPDRSRVLRRDLALPFTILCDTRREVLAAYGILNRWEAGGVAHPALLVLDRNRRVLYRSLDRRRMRVRAGDLAAYLASRPARGGEPAGVEASAEGPRRRFVPRGMDDLLRSLRSLIRNGYRSPRR